MLLHAGINFTMFVLCCVLLCPRAQGPRVMTIKYAVQDAVPGALLWLDQDQRDKTQRGARATQ